MLSNCDRSLIAIEVNDCTVNALTINGEIKNIPAQDFNSIKRCDSSQARELLDRLRNLYQQGLYPTAKLVIEAFASKPIPQLTETEDCLLNCLERKNHAED